MLNALLWDLAASSSLIIGASVGVVWRLEPPAHLLDPRVWCRRRVGGQRVIGAGSRRNPFGGYRVLAVGVAVGAITINAADLGLQ
jgi:hypothetical protein